MLHYYIAFMLHAVGRRPKGDEPVFNRLEEVRRAAGLSRNELADAIGVHYQTVGYLERGEYTPSLSLALRIAATLNLEVENIFSLSPFDHEGATDADHR
jgi:putative transcriptional regulator